MKEEHETYFKSTQRDVCIRTEPDAYNDFVLVRRYKVTIELIDEPKEVIQQRIDDLMDKTKNSHARESIRKYCHKNGFNYKN